MSYVKVSDPAIIDLAGIQQIISVVNQHSDYLNVLINRFGTIVSPDYGAASTQGIYDAATTQIAFGKAEITSSDTGTTTNGKTYYTQDFTYGPGITFSASPLITLALDNSQGAAGGQLDFILSLHNVTTTGFDIRAVRSGFYNNKQTLDNSIQVNWIAIGPR